jgi:hypothetical protein
MCTLCIHCIYKLYTIYIHFICTCLPAHYSQTKVAVVFLFITSASCPTNTRHRRRRPASADSPSQTFNGRTHHRRLSALALRRRLRSTWALLSDAWRLHLSANSTREEIYAYFGYNEYADFMRACRFYEVTRRPASATMAERPANEWALIHYCQRRWSSTNRRSRTSAYRWHRQCVLDRVNNIQPRRSHRRSHGHYKRKYIVPLSSSEDDSSDSSTGSSTDQESPSHLSSKLRRRQQARPDYELELWIKQLQAATDRMERRQDATERRQDHTNQTLMTGVTALQRATIETRSIVANTPLSTAINRGTYSAVSLQEPAPIGEPFGLESTPD